MEGKKRSLQLDMDSLERLFLELEGRPESRLRELRYVICLLLMRKRRVKVLKVERGSEGESFLVRRPRRDESLRVFVFDFDAERMEELRHDLQAIFDGAEEEGELKLPDPPDAAEKAEQSEHDTFEAGTPEADTGGAEDEEAAGSESEVVEAEAAAEPVPADAASADGGLEPRGRQG